MSEKEYARIAFNKGVPEKVPLWELHFHLWNKYSDEKAVFGGDFLALPDGEKDDALKRDAEIMAKVGQELGFGAVSVPDMPWDCPYTLPEDARLKLIRFLRELEPDFLVGGGNSCCLAMPDNEEYMDFSYMMYDAPEKIVERAENMLTNGLEQLGRMADAGAEFVYLPSDLSDARAPYFNPEQLEEFFMPFAKRWSARVKELGLIPIFHTDGNIMPIIDKAVETGVNALQALDPIAGITVGGLREMLEGKLCLCGNVDCGLMLSGAPEAVYASTADIIAQGKGSPFVLGNSNAVVYATPKENYDAFLQAWRDNR
ncbi:MAG: hypothetical protein J5441_04040 [Clostridia bacterium]|nr:hypothetical protein [Clostridia bacterium]